MEICIWLGTLPISKNSVTILHPYFFPLILLLLPLLLLPFFRETDKTERQNIEETAKTREFLPRKPLRQSTLIILTKYLTTSIALGSWYSQCVPIKKSKRIRMLEDEGIGILVSTPPRGIRQPAQLRLNVIKTTEQVLQTTVRRVYLA